MQINTETSNERELEAPSIFRWWVLLMYCLYSFTNEGNWLTYSSILSQSSEFYSHSIEDIIWYSTNYFLIYIFFSFMGSWMVFKRFRVSMLLGTFLNTLGSWIRYVSGKSSGIAMFGQCLIAFSAIWALETPIVLSEMWFPKKERFMALSIGIYSNPLGAGLSYIFSACVVNDESQKILELLFISAIITTIPFLMVFLLFQRKEKYSISNNQSSFFMSMKLLIKNKSYMFSMFFFSFTMGHIWSIESLLDLLLVPQLMTVVEVGVTGLILVLSGILSGLLVSVILSKSSFPREKFQDYLIKIFMTISLLCLILLCILLHANMALVSFLFGMLGFGFLGVVPLICDALAEIAYPVEETLSNNLWFVMVNVVALLETNIFSRDSFDAQERMVALTAIFVLPWIFTIFFYRTTFRKTMALKTKESQTVFQN